MRKTKLSVLVFAAMFTSGVVSASSSPFYSESHSYAAYYDDDDYEYADDYEDKGWEKENRYEDDYEYEYAGQTGKGRVLKVIPVYELRSVTIPEKQCWNETVRNRTRHGDSMTPTITGAILGGVIGNQFGHGDGKKLMTAVGTLLGGSMGNDVRRRNSGYHEYTTVEKRCETVNRVEEREEITGYRVKYRYHGRNYWTRTINRPGKFLRVTIHAETDD